MASNPGTPKFPSAIPNPLGQKSPKNTPTAQNSEPAVDMPHMSSNEPAYDAEEKTDPNLVLPSPIPPPSAGPALQRQAQAVQQPTSSNTATPVADPFSPTNPSLQINQPQAPQTNTAPAPVASNPAQPRASESADPELPPQATAQQLRIGRMPEMGILDPLMKDPKVTEIMVNDLRNIMIEKQGRLVYSGLTFTTIDELNRLTRNILDITGRILSPDQPYVDVMLCDGSRVNIVAPPLTLVGPCLTIRKFPEKQLLAADLIAGGMVDQRIAYFLNACVLGKLNMLVSGGTGTGKTTLLNVLGSFIPKKERVITIEDTPELSLNHANSVRLQTKPRTPASQAIFARELLSNALRMRPDRIIVGECRNSEAFDMLQAMNTGHAGSMTTIHANSPRDAISRLETLCMLAGTEIPAPAIRKQIVSALDLIVQIRRFRDGTRRVIAISEITGMEGETVTLQDIFVFQLNIEDSTDSRQGQFKATGMVPTFLDRLKEYAIELPRNYFA